MERTSGKPVFEIEGLTKVYGEGETRVQALRGVSFTVQQGEMVAITGPSGSGKSTLLAMLGAVDNPTDGRILLEGVDLALLSDERRTLIRRRRIGFVFQAFNLLPVLSAIENVSLPLELDGVSATEANRRAADALQLVEMLQRREHLPGMLSGGEQQRVAIARALAIEPAIVLADEPTGNLDSVNSQRVMQLLRRLVDEQQQTVILVTHDPVVAAMADRNLRMQDGQLQGGEAIEQAVQREAAAAISTQRA
ncbi:MAG: ABC transporter ATP-binding protein [Planctomycetales bacterium]|nr:ABC transporter ATP-binding protein [Planctomycetales bacterium]